MSAKKAIKVNIKNKGNPAPKKVAKKTGAKAVIPQKPPKPKASTKPSGAKKIIKKGKATDAKAKPKITRKKVMVKQKVTDVKIKPKKDSPPKVKKVIAKKKTAPEKKEEKQITDKEIIKEAIGESKFQKKIEKSPPEFAPPAPDTSPKKVNIPPPPPPSTGATETPLSDKLKEKINIINEDRKAEFSLKGPHAVRNVIKSSEKEIEDKEIEEIVDKKFTGSRSVKLYRKIAFSFVALTLVLLAVIFYFSFVKVTIVLIPNQERISNNMIFDIYDSEKHSNINKNSIGGLVKKVKIKNTKEYEATGTEVIGKEAVGKATIINNYNKNQPLVATTRLLAPDGKLFRINETINVPAGDQVEVDIYADEPSPEMAIGPTKFTIPGLWAGLQEQIYAENSEDIVYRQKVKKHILQEDIDNGVRDLKQELLAGAKTEINEKYKDYDQIIYKIDENSIVSDITGKVDEEKDNFIVLMEAEVIVVAFNDKTAIKLAQQKFTSSLPEKKELLSFDEKNIIYALNNYDHVEGVATVSSTFEGKVTLKDNTEIIDIDKILGLNREQLEVYLEEIPEIAGFEITFYPTFIKKVPRLVDRVSVEIKK